MPTSLVGFRAACATCEVVWAKVCPLSVRCRDVLLHDQTDEAFLDELRRYATEAQAAPNLYHFQRPPAFFRRPPVLATFRNRGAESIALLPGRPCPLYATIFRERPKTELQMRECGTGESIRVSDFFCALLLEHSYTQALTKLDLIF